MTQPLEHQIVSLAGLLADSSLFRSGKVERQFFLGAIRSRLLAKSPIDFISYWGIGWKASPDIAEARALDFQRDWINRFHEIIGSRPRIHYLVTDTHAQINGIPGEVVQEYGNSMSKILEGEGFNVEFMSSLMSRTEAAGIREMSLGFHISEEHWELLQASKLRELERLASVQIAQRGNSPRQLAQSYYRQNLLESSAVSLLFPSALFLTYQPPQMSFFLPSLPRLHAYVDRNRSVKRPWLQKVQREA